VPRRRGGRARSAARRLRAFDAPRSSASEQNHHRGRGPSCNLPRHRAPSAPCACAAIATANSAHAASRCSDRRRDSICAAARNSSLSALVIGSPSTCLRRLSPRPRTAAATPPTLRPRPFTSCAVAAICCIRMLTAVRRFDSSLAKGREMLMSGSAGQPLGLSPKIVAMTAEKSSSAAPSSIARSRLPRAARASPRLTPEASAASPTSRMSLAACRSLNVGG
jgi:hypothetical protein